MEIRDRAWLECHGFNPARAGLDNQPMVNEIEVDLKAARAMRDQGCRQASGGHVKRNVPPMVHRRRMREPDLPHDLSPKLQRGASVGPFGEWQIQPLGGGGLNDSAR